MSATFLNAENTAMTKRNKSYFLEDAYLFKISSLNKIFGTLDGNYELIVKSAQTSRGELHF